MESSTGSGSLRRRIGLLFAVSLACVGLAASPASAEDGDHTHEKFSFSDTFETGGYNPCTDTDVFGLAHVVVSIDVEVENGDVHEAVGLTGSLDFAEGFQGTLNEQHNAEVDASGNGKVEIEAQFKLRNTESGDKFEVHVKALLTIGGFEVVDAWDEVVISECDRG